MLFYSGFVKYMGGTKHQNISFKGYGIIIQLDVDRGDTVLDYLKMERERGITITSAAITFKYETFALYNMSTNDSLDGGIILLT